MLIALSIANSKFFGVLWYGFIALVVLSEIMVFRLKDLDRKPIREINILLMPLLFVSIASIIWNHLSIGRVEVLEIIIGSIIFCIAIQRVAFSESQLFNALKAAILLGVVAAVYERFFLGTQRVDGSGVSINFGIASAVATTTLLSALLNNHGKLHINLLSCAAGALLIVFTASRGPSLALICCVLFLVLDIKNSMASSKTSMIQTSAYILAMSALAIVVGWNFISRDTIIFGDFGVALDNSSTIRLSLFERSLLSIANHPLFGIGADQAGEFFKLQGAPLDEFNTAHSTIVNLTLELGLLGGLAYAWIFVRSLKYFRSIKNRNRLWYQIGVTITVSIFVASLFQDVMSHAYTRQLIALYLAIIITLGISARKGQVST